MDYLKIFWRSERTKEQVENVKLFRNNPLAVKNKIRTFTSDFGFDVNEFYMRNVAEKTNGYYFHIFETKEIDPVFNYVLAVINNKYKIEFSYCNFGKDKLLLDLCFNEDKFRIERTFKISTPEIEIINLYVKFDFDKYIIKPEFYPNIKKFTDFIKKYPKLRVELSGHTDTVGTLKYNYTLSRNRSNAVRNYIIKKYKIKPERLVPAWYSKTQIIDKTIMYNDRRVSSKLINPEVLKLKDL